MSKLKPSRIYNGLSEKEENDTYDVRWNLQNGPNELELVVSSLNKKSEKMSDIFYTSMNDEISMEAYSNIVGVSFENALEFIKDDGWIKIYDDETNDLLCSFTKNELEKYLGGNIYKFDNPVKYIRMETSEILQDKSMTVVVHKELDDEAITNNFTKEEFDDLVSIKSFLCVDTKKEGIVYASAVACYEDQYSDAKLLIKKSTLSTQVTEKNEVLTIEALADEKSNQIAWRNGSFLIKLPDNIIATEINSVKIDNYNVELVSYEYLENDNGKFIKINTSNNDDELQTFDVIINVDLTPDPRIASKTEYIELYAYNEATACYYYSSEDIYDVNDNLNVKEKVHKSSTSVQMVSPNSLLTNQIISDFDELGSIVISPQVADVRPNLTTNDVNQEEKTVKIGVQIKNNYPDNLSDVKILGKIPFEGNTYVLSEGDLNSQFTTKMQNTGIEVPAELQEKITVYYSENENPDRDINNSENGWKVAEQVENWDNIKTYLIDFQDQIVKIRDEFTFYYTVRIPNGINYNAVAYSHHGIWFTLDTKEGKYRTKTEPNKIGIRISEKYDLEIDKYHLNRDDLVPGATYMIIKEATNTEKEQMKTAVTNAEGKLQLQNLYAEAVYSIQEIKSPENYELNYDVIKFIAHVQDDGTLSVEKQDGTVRDDILVEKIKLKNDEERFKVIIKVEDETKAKLKISKYQKDTAKAIKGVKYKLTSEYSDIEKYITTNNDGEINISGLSIGEVYTLEEVKAEGYYLNNSVSFALNNEDDAYIISIYDGDVKSTNVIYENNIPIINMELEDVKIPLYTLEITKVKKMVDVSVGENQQEENVVLPGAKFKLYKNSKELGSYVTDENGKITIEGLYQYIDYEDEEAEYILKEVLAPEGYSKVKDIKFRVDGSKGNLKFVSLDNKEYKYTIDENIVKLIVEDTPAFKIIKKDAETGERIADVKFAIYNVDDNMLPARNSKGEIVGTKEIIDGKQYYIVETNNQGEVLVDLPEGSYKAVEVQAPEKYDISDSSYYFGIGGSREGKDGYTIGNFKQIAADGTEKVASIEYTVDGGYVVAGTFSSEKIILGNDITLINHGATDGMLIKYDDNHECVWAKSIGGTGSDDLQSVEQTMDGGYIVSGVFASDTINLENGNVLSGTAGNNDCFIIKYNHLGELEWSKVIAGNRSDNIEKVVEDNEGNFIAVGSFYSDSINITDEITLKNVSTYSWTGLLIKFNSTGKTVWAKTIGGSGYDHLTTVALSNDGGYIVGGDFSSTTVNLENNIILNHKSNTDGMIIKYDNAGECEWAKVIGGSGNDYVTSIDVGENDEIFVAGYYNSSYIDLENGKSLDNSYTIGDDGFVIKYDNAGELIYCKSIGGTKNDQITQIKADSNGGYAVVGSFKSSIINLDDNYMQNSNTNKNNGFFIKYAENGECEYLKAIQGESEDAIVAVDESENGYYLIGCNFDSSTINLGNSMSVSNIGNYDVLVMELNPNEMPNPTATNLQGVYGDRTTSINSVEKTSDGGYIIGAQLSAGNINFGNDVYINSTSHSNRGAIIKYNSEGKCEWAKDMQESIHSYIQKVIETQDGGYIAIGGYDYNRVVR